MLGTVCSFSKIEGDDKGCAAVISFKAVDGADMARDLDAIADAVAFYTDFLRNYR